ncbi:hypothetical protein [Pseudoflavonifractor sp. MSJ-37]|uniref:hypothetical protein n=1 Tax=Pseudoflavonifractor sp. MSJ-37 TaxID=2841531 RepID=UPI001C100BC3|nr:hypothetical protein [Pseudoflavonifractor sp. MSJ-37]MBU5436122.1 hypothetical protein [Pseudoflavonifractor sp. MSJ-37]
MIFFFIWYTPICDRGLILKIDLLLAVDHIAPLGAGDGDGVDQTISSAEMRSETLIARTLSWQVTAFPFREIEGVILAWLFHLAAAIAPIEQSMDRMTRRESTRFLNM